MRYFLLFSLALLSTCPAFAELYECNGTWTNRSCESEASTVIAERPLQQRSQEQVDRDQKKLWIHSIESKLFEARREFGIEIDITAVHSTCSEQSSSLIECRKEIDEIENTLDRRILSRHNTSVKQEKQQQENSETSDTIVYIDNRLDYPYRYYNRRDYRYRGKARNSNRVKKGNPGLSSKYTTKPVRSSNSSPVRAQINTKNLLSSRGSNTQ